MKETKTYVKPEISKSAVRYSSVHVCCGMGSKATCHINRSRIS